MPIRKALNSVILLLFLVLLVFVSPSSVYAADDPTWSDRDQVPPSEVSAMRSVSFLSREVSKSLEIARVPTSEPIPLIVGTYWNCVTNDQDLEICDITLVVCNDDQSFCTQIP